MAKDAQITRMFSVVIPLYNKADTIERAVRSVWGQTFRDFELVVVNDGSTDASLSVVKRLSEEIPMRIVDKVNGGVSSARNAGANVAIGKYIALLDGDDMWLPEHLELIGAAIVKFPDVKFFGSGYERIANKSVYYTIPWGGMVRTNVYSAFRYAQPINSSTVAIERCLWQSVGGFDERYSFYEDYEFFFRIGMHTQCCIVQKISARYMNDANVQATKKTDECSPQTRPHLKTIEKCLRDVVSDANMFRYARTQIWLSWALNVQNKTEGKYRLFWNAFPVIVRFSPPDIVVRHYYVARIVAALYLLYYKFRNHLIIWKRAI